MRFMRAFTRRSGGLVRVMQGAGSDSLTENVAPAAGSGDVRQRQPARNNGWNIVRFASVLVGAGLLLRVGAAEQANSAIDEEQPRLEKPLKARITLPQPAFGQPANIANAGKTPSSIPAIQPAVAKAELAHSQPASSVRDLAAAQSTRPGDDMEVSQLAKSATVRVGRADSKLQNLVGASGADKLALEQPALVAPPKVESATTAHSAVAKVPDPAAYAPAAASPVASRRRVADGLLAPVKIVASTNPQLTPMRTASALAPARQSSGVAVKPRDEQPVRISLAPPVMTPGPRTTVMTSNISDEMRRPASAWDYAEALPPELTGAAAAAARRSASAELDEELPAAPAQTRQAARTPASDRPVDATPATREIAVAPALATRRERAAVALEPAGLAEVRTTPVSADKRQASPTAALQAAPASAVREDRRRIALLDQKQAAEPRQPAKKVSAKAPAPRFGRREDDGEAMVAARTPLGQVPTSNVDKADEEADHEATTLSLRDRIPHPAF